jgi:ABC-type lipoprotein release transport system permease subunit
MNLRLIQKEIFHSKVNFLLAVLAIVIGVALFVSFYTMSEASNRETIRLTRDMGFNLRIIPKETDMDKFWHRGYSEYTMPQDNVAKFMAFKDFSFAHLTATLHHKLQWQGMEIVLTGISDELEPSGREKTPMIHIIKPGEVILGYEISNKLGISQGDRISLLGKEFIMSKALSESGSMDDIRLYARLEEIQDILGMEGRVNEIRALNCLCLTTGKEDPLIILRNQLQKVLPESRIVMDKNIAMARERQRLMFEKYFAFIIPFVVITCAVWIGTIILLNVRDRKAEIGILRALGYGGGYIATLFLGKAVVFGLLGAILGFFIGSFLSLAYGPDIFMVTASSVKPIYSLLGWSMLAAVVFSVTAALLPTFVAITQDPAQTLRGE